LGNPGKRYANTPHNAGFAVIDELAAQTGCRLRRAFRTRARVGDFRLAGDRVFLVQPLTFMNLSGEAVTAILRYHRASAEDMVVVLDDADLPRGRLRVRASGGSGGHRGLDSVVRHVGSEAFTRVRIGVGRDVGGRDLVDHVLATPGRAAREQLAASVERGAEAVQCCLREGVAEAMNRFNGPVGGESKLDAGGS